jgi:hypothetical protein
MNHYASSEDNKETTYLFKVDVFTVLIKVRSGYVVEVSCGCTSECEVIEPLFGSTYEKQEHCEHAAAAVTHLFQEKGRTFGYDVEEIE